MPENRSEIRGGLEHGKYAYEAKDAFGYVQKINKFQIMDIVDKVTQDILIVGANKDHFIHYTMVGEKIAALKMCVLLRYGCSRTKRMPATTVTVEM